MPRASSSNAARLLRVGLAGHLLDALLDGIDAPLESQLQLPDPRLEQGNPRLALPLILAEQQLAHLIHLLVVWAGRGAYGRAELCIGRGVHER